MLTSCSVLILVLQFSLELSTPSQGMWFLRAGQTRTTQPLPQVMGASLYLQSNVAYSAELPVDAILDAVSSGDRSMIVPLATLLISWGEFALAEEYWEMKGADIPCTRNDLLDALAWYARFDLYSTMSLNPPVPADMEESMHADHCAAICALGWMRPREDGLFHGSELVSAEDIQLLAGFFANVDPDQTRLPQKVLNTMFQQGSGAYEPQ
ncbi:MAG: hypothetical protein GY852_10170 [bacterium]|nr:hypothetical protein [bacterium]